MYSSPYILFRATNSHARNFSSEKLKGSDNFGDQGIEGEMILTWMFKKWGVDWINMTEDEVQSKRLSPPYSLSLYVKNITKPKAYKMYT